MFTIDVISLHCTRLTQCVFAYIIWCGLYELLIRVMGSQGLEFGIS